jgi:hypothetical protein
MAIAPSSTIYFCNVPWSSDYAHVCDVSNVSTLLLGPPLIKSVSDYTYIRKDSTINVSVPMDELIGANYVMYKNVAHENETFYAFIESMEYKSDMATAVKIRTDVYQTWRSVMTVPSCFVEREHANTDTIGANVVDEGLETGEYVKNSTDTIADLMTLCYIAAVSETSDATPVQQAGRIYSGIFSGLAYYPFFGVDAVAELQSFLNDYDREGKANAVAAIFTYPRNLLPSGAVSGSPLTSDSMTSPSISKTVTYSQSTIDGYTPTNKKLLTFPYNFLHVTNLQGQAADYHFELLNNNNGSFSFIVNGAMIPGAKVGLYPEAYKMSIGYNVEEALTIQNYPLCGWVSDAYANWVAQNAGQIAMTTLGGAAAVATGAVTASLPVAAGGIAAIFSQLLQIAPKQREPDHAKGNSNTSSLMIASGFNSFYFHQMTIQYDQAQRLDEFFSAYGYKTNRFKVPNLTGRDTWNYVKTIDCIVKGGIPEDDRKQIQTMLNNGVTIWHTFTNFGDYSQANAIS